MDSIKAKNTDYLELVTNNQRKAAFVLHNKLNMNNLKVIDDEVIRIYDTAITPSQITKTLIVEDIDVESMTKKQTSLEEYFIKKVGLEKINH